MSSTSQGAEPARFPLVLSQEQREALQKLAEKENRTLSGQIRHLIQKAAAEEDGA